MVASGSPPKRPRNRILGALSARDYDELSSDLELVDHEVREIVYDIGRPIQHVHFVETGVLSIVAVMADGSAVETATVGNEGMLGIPIFLDTDRSATQAFCQVRGQSLRMRSADFRRHLNAETKLRSILNRYTQALFTQIAQSAACNRLHAVRERMARWLLQTHDRVGLDEFSLTQDFMSQMLGVRRATVTEAAGSLQKDGLIEYAYGRMRIKNRTGIERASCECYAIVRSEFDRLLGDRKTASPLDGVKGSRDGKTTLNNSVPPAGAEALGDD